MTEYIFIISLFWDGDSKMHRKPKTQGNVRECCPNFQHRPHHLLRWETIVYIVFPDARSLDHAS